MPVVRRLFVAVLFLMPLSLAAQEWAAYGTISAEPTPGRICTGDPNGKDILCASPAPYVDASGNVTANGAIIITTGNVSVPSWTTTGLTFSTTAATYTDTTTAASGTVATRVASSLGIPTFAATNTAVTVTNAANLYIAGAPAAGTNTTLSNTYALYVANNISFMGTGIRFVAGGGNGIGFWATTPQTYGSFMSNSASYQYGDVTDYYIANVMSAGTSRGFVWSYGTAPRMALNANSGNLAIKGTLTVNGTGDSTVAGNLGIGTAALLNNLHVFSASGMGITAETSLATAAANFSTVTPNRSVSFSNNDNSDIYGIWDNTGSAWAINIPYATRFVGIGGSPDRKLHSEYDSATTNAVTFPLRLTSTSSGTPANGIGAGLEFEVETTASNNEVGATIEAVVTDVTAASEDFDLVFRTMAAGAAASEAFRITSTNNVRHPASAYINFGATDGTTGYGFRDNAGALEFKNSGGSWAPFASGVATNFAAGAVGAPGLYVTGDTNTGLYQATADTLSITAGGTEVARFVTTASAVNYFNFAPSAGASTVTLSTAGTGATVPITIDAKGTSAITLVDAVNMSNGLTVTGAVDVSTQFLGQAADTASAPSFSWTGDTNTGMWRPAADTVAFTTNGSEAMRINSSNQVGINTTSPKTTLDVGGAIVGGADGSYIGFNTYYSSGWKHKANGYASFLRQGTQGMQLDSAPNNASGADAAMTPVYAMTIDPTGNVGIGTATPGGTLHVYAPSTNTASDYIGLRLTGAQSTANTASY